MKTLIVIAAFVLVSCGEDPNRTVNIDGTGNEVNIFDLEGTITQACSGLIVRTGMDCDDDEVRVRCEQCLDPVFRAEISDDPEDPISVASCTEVLQEQGFCDE